MKKKTVMKNQTKTYQTKNDDRTRRSWKPGWPECRTASARVKTNARVRGKASKVDDEAVLHTCIPSIFPWTKSATPRNLPEERRRQLAVALLCNTGEKPRARSASTRLPFFQVVDRQDGTDGCAVSDTGPVETAAGHQRSENWSRCRESGSESSSAAEVGGFSKARKRKKQETNWWVKTLKWQRSSRHVRQKCSRQNPCHPARFDLYAQDDVFANAPLISAS